MDIQMNTIIHCAEGLNLPFQEEVALLSAVASSPVRKLYAAARKSYQAKKYWTTALCIITGMTYIAITAAMIWFLFPAMKAIFLAKFAASPLLAKAGYYMTKWGLTWGIRKVVAAISQIITS